MVSDLPDLAIRDRGYIVAGHLGNVLHGKLLDVGQVLVVLTEIAEVHLDTGLLVLLGFRVLFICLSVYSVLIHIDHIPTRGKGISYKDRYKIKVNQ